MLIKNRIVLFFMITVLGCQSHNQQAKDAFYYVDHSHPAVETFDSRIQFLILHYTAVDEEQSFHLLTSPTWPASAHYLVTEQPPKKRNLPVVYQLVDEKERAWQAGASRWGTNGNLNAGSIGIEIVNFGYVDAPDPDDDNAIYQQLVVEDRMGASRKVTQEELMKHKRSWTYAEERYWFPYTEAQINAVILLAKDIVKRHDIAPENILGHTDIAPQRKNDPGPLFPWKKLYEEGVGAWYEEDTMFWYLDNRSREQEVDPTLLLKALAIYGYAVPTPIDNRIPGNLVKESERQSYQEEVQKVIRAFQMHFRPENFSGIADVESEAIALALVERYKGEDVAKELVASSRGS